MKFLEENNDYLDGANDDINTNILDDNEIDIIQNNKNNDKCDDFER